MIYLSAAELLHVARRAIGAEVDVRDHGLRQSAAARPQATVGGQDAYPDLATKAGALMHFLARNHPLIDGSKRLALAATIACVGVNGRRLSLTNDQAYDVTMAVAAGDIDDVEHIAARLRASPQPR